jgi:hypothetical protein
MAMIGGTGRVGFFVNHAELNVPYKASDIRELFETVTSEDNVWGRLTAEQSKAIIVNLYRSSCYDVSFKLLRSRTVTLHSRKIEKHKPQETLTKEMCIHEASKHTHPSDWDKACSRSYLKAIRNGWLEICCEHMNLKVDLNHHDKITCMKSAAKFKHRSLWARGDSCRYYSAVRHGWLDECCEHMELSPYFANRRSRSNARS